MSYIDPDTTEVILKYKDKHYHKAILKDNPHNNGYPNNGYRDENEYLLDGNTRVQIESEWSDLSEKEFILNSQVLHKLHNNDLKSILLVLLSESQNSKTIKLRNDNETLVNPNGFGKGTVYRNFDYQNIIRL